MKKTYIIITFVSLTLCYARVWAQDSTLSPKAWIRHTIDSSSSGADGAKLADINQDGHPDIATGWEEGSITKLYVHPGPDKVTQAWPAVTVGETPHVEDAVFADMDDDGRLDIVSCTENVSRKIVIHLSPEAELLNPQKWQQLVLPASEGRMMWMYAEPLQVDGRYGVDLVAAGKGEGAALGWFEAPETAGDWEAWKWHPISPVGWIMSIMLRDMDYDGDTDVVISDRRGPQQACRWLENPGSAANQKRTWKNHVIGGEGKEFMFMTMADMDGDGTEEVVAAERTDQTISIYQRQNKAGTQWKEQMIVLPQFTGRAKSVAVGDMNGDGVADLVHSTNTEGLDKVGLTWVDGRSLNDPSDAIFQSISGVHPAKFDKVELIDLDEDGDLDVLTCEENYGADSNGLGVIWYENPQK